MEHLNEKSIRTSPTSPLNARAQAGEPVKEVEFMANESRRLQQLADLLKSDAQARIEFYLKEKLNHGTQVHLSD